MINKEHLKSVIEKALIAIGMHSDSAVNLLLGTAAQESGFGYYLRQLNGGPAVGIFQMEPFTFEDHVVWLKTFKPEIAEKIKFVSGVNDFKVQYLEFNLMFAACMARVHYYRVPKPLPDADNIVKLGQYWKKYYNTYLGSGTIDEFVYNYKKYIL